MGQFADDVMGSQAEQLGSEQLEGRREDVDLWRLSGAGAAGLHGLARQAAPLAKKSDKTQGTEKSSSIKIILLDS